MKKLSNKQPRYLQLAQTLINEIEAGTYAIGSLMPTEHELCEQFGASRFTVREAIKRLVSMDLVDRQPGVGTRVKAKRIESVYHQKMQSINDLQQYTKDAELEIIKKETIIVEKKSLLSILDAKKGETWLHLEALRYTIESDKPIGFIEIYIHPAFRSISGLKGRLNVPVFSIIEDQFGEYISEIRQELSAIEMSKSVAPLVMSEAGAPALKICRQYIDLRNQVIEAAISIHPSKRFSYIERFKRNLIAR